MAGAPDKNGELRALLCALSDETLTSEQRERLNELLLGDPDAKDKAAPVMYETMHRLSQAHLLDAIDCHSLYTPTDTTVIPGWRAVLPRGSRRALPVFTHRQLIIHPRAIADRKSTRLNSSHRT